MPGQFLVSLLRDAGLIQKCMLFRFLGFAEWIKQGQGGGKAGTKCHFFWGGLLDVRFLFVVGAKSIQ